MIVPHTRRGLTAVSMRTPQRRALPTAASPFGRVRGLTPAVAKRAEESHVHGSHGESAIPLPKPPDRPLRTSLASRVRGQTPAVTARDTTPTGAEDVTWSGASRRQSRASPGGELTEADPAATQETAADSGNAPSR